MTSPNTAAAQNDDASAGRSMFASLKSLFVSRPDRPAAEPDMGRALAASQRASASEILDRLKAMLAQRERAHGIAEAERLRVGELEERLESMGAERIGVLTAARIEGGEEAKARADDLTAQCEAVRREIADAKAIESNLRSMQEDLGRQIDAMKPAYRHAVGGVLDALYAEAMARYNESAPSVAAAALRVAAIRRVMVRHGCGNSNGWSGEIHLPGMKPGIGSGIAPILVAGSAEFDRAATGMEANVLRAIQEAGFHLGLDWK